MDVTKLREVASSLIAANGRVVTLVRRNIADNDSAQPWRGPPATSATTLQVDVKAVAVELSEDDMKNDLLRTMTKKFIVSASDLEAAATAAGNPVLADARNFDTLIDESDTIEIAHVIPYKPGTVALGYSLYAEG